MAKANQYKIFDELDSIKSTYEGGSAERIAGLYRSPYKVIRMCEFYSASRYLGSGTQLVMSNGVMEYQYNKDGLGRDKPFYNIVNFRVALAKTATDLDVHDIQISADNPKYTIQSMLLNREAYEWMKTDFGQTLNKMGMTRPKYGGYLIKKTENEGKLKIEVMDWTKVYTDISNIMGGPIVECHNMSPVELKKKDGSWDDVNVVLKAHKGLKDKNKTNKIEVYEVLGEFPKTLFNQANDVESTDEDEFTFSLQKYFIADVGSKKYILYSDEPKGEISDYYEYLSWEDQSLDLGRGVIEDAEEAQVWTNDSVINEKNAMDLAGRVGIKTTSKTLGGNILEHDHGKIYELNTNEDINSFNLAPSSLGQYQNQIDKWKQQANDATSSYDAQTGETPPSGTPYSQTALLNQVSSKPFDYKREEWGLHLTKIFDNWVIPFLVKKLKKPHTLVSSDFSDEELQAIDESIANETSNQAITDHIMNGGEVTPQDQQMMIADIKAKLQKHGKKRYIDLPANYFDNIETKVTVVTTGEQKNKSVIIQSLSQLLHDVQGSYNPNTGKFGILEDSTLAKIFAEIVELSGTGISPASLGLGIQKPATTQPQPPQGQPQPSPMQPPSQPLAPMGNPTP